MIKLIALIDPDGTGGFYPVPNAVMPARFNDRAPIMERIGKEMFDARIVVGYRTWRGFTEANKRDPRLRVWRDDADPESFLAEIEDPAVDTVIAGGLSTYKAFGPFVDLAIIVRVPLFRPEGAVSVAFPFDALTGS